jgi:glycosyltransferase involved in cell wall biosynthesis
VEVRATAWEICLDPRAWWHLRRTISAFQPDVIHVHDSHALTLAATVALGRTLVATRRVDFRVGRFGAWRRPDRIIAVSAAVKDVLTRDGIASEAIVVVPDGIDPDAVRRASTPPLGMRRQARTLRERAARRECRGVGRSQGPTHARARRRLRARWNRSALGHRGRGPLRADLTAEIRACGSATVCTWWDSSSGSMP